MVVLLSWFAFAWLVRAALGLGDFKLVRRVAIGTAGAVGVAASGFLESRPRSSLRLLDPGSLVSGL